MPERPNAPEIARFLRQRMELGEESWTLEELSRERAVAMVKGGGGGASAPQPTEAPTPPASRRSTAMPERTAPPQRAAEPGNASPELPHDLEALRTLAQGCTLCPLAQERTQVVFADGNPKARLMVVGEAPGANEDATGLPFVGAAGKLLDLLLATVGFSREETVYIANVIKCRPPGNRNPLPAEIEACSPYLRRQIELVAPEAILAVGTFSGQLLSGKDLALGKLRGEVYSFEGIPLVVTYHPAALLRNSGWTRSTWDDLQLLRNVMDREAT